MRQYTNETISVIKRQIVDNETNIICIEGIDVPAIYKDICNYFKTQEPGLTFIAKMTKEKYEQFHAENKEAWNNALNYLAENDFIDYDGAMTRWRNNAADVGVGNTTTLVLLMGTEAAPDNGGLQDFYHISPRDIIDSLSKNYSRWFAGIFERCNLDEDDKKAIDTLYKIIFNETTIDLIKLSNFIDSISDYEFYTTQDLVNHICATMNTLWGIPPVLSSRAVPAVKNLCGGKLNSGKIITDAYSFIIRKDDIPTKSKIVGYRKKLEKYAEKNNIASDTPFPEDTRLFNSYEEFGNYLIEFMCGKDVDIHKNKFLQLDYAIVSNIINTKLDKEPKKHTVPTVTGEPLEAYLKMLSASFKAHFEFHKRLPEKAIIRVTEVKLSNCATNDEPGVEYADTLEAVFANMCSFLGGIVDFIDNSELENSDGNIIEIKYENDFDPFVIDNFEVTKERLGRNLGVTKRFNELSRVNFIVRIIDDEEDSKYEYKWLFTPQNAWKNSFALINSIVKSDTESFDIPSMLSCDNINEYICCESEDEFYTKLEQIKINNLYIDHRAAIREKFNDENTLQLFDGILDYFMEWAKTLCSKGLFNSYEQLHKVVKKYDDLMLYVNDKFDIYTSTQKENLHLFLNSFLIVDNRKALETGEIKEVLVPAYHPVMLEKIAAKMSFLRQGFKELIADIVHYRGKGINIDAIINKFAELSSITIATDTILTKNNNYLMCQNVWNYYGVCFDENTSNAIIPSGTYGGIIIDEDSEDKSAMLKSSPESNIIYRNLLDYIRTFPARIDGLNICFVDPKDMQHIVAGVHNIAEKLEKDGASAVINVKIVCLDNQKNSSSYLRYWLDNYFGEERAVKVNIFLTYLTIDINSINTLDAILANQDMCFIYNILTPSQVNFKKVELHEADVNQSKFPMTFVPDTISRTQGRRNVNISQFQFLASKAHTQLAHTIGNRNDEKGVYKVMRLLSLEEIQEKIMDKAHALCNWVVCIDESIDRYILQNENRKIIGFTTGEGCFGELNVTVSAKENILADIQNMLKRRIIEKFKNWNIDRLEASAKFCIDITKDLDGSRILKALNPYDYEVHNYLAYVLTLQKLKLRETGDEYLVRNLINLDSYKHWFLGELDKNEDDNKSRPDFMLLEILKTDENLSKSSKLKIKITVIECKMGISSPEKIEKARNQVEHGIKVMSQNWDTNSGSISRRYWFNQLYRSIIFSPLNLDDNKSEYAIFSEKIFDILNGNFEIEWAGDIFAFWLNKEGDTYEEYPINHNLDDIGINFAGLTCHVGGQQFIQKWLVPEEERETGIFIYNEIEVSDEDAGADDPEDIAMQTTPVITIQDVRPDPEITVESEGDGESEITVEVIPAGETENTFTDETDNDESVSVEENDQNNTPNNADKPFDVSKVRVLLGEDMKTKEKIYWEFGNKNLNNRHLLINGNSGCGKTYCIQALLLELALQGVSSVIFDYTDGFTKSKLDKVFVEKVGDKLVQRYIKTKKMPINPFKKQEIQLGDELVPEENVDIAMKISNIFSSVYSFGDQQRSAIYQAVLSGLKKYGDDMNFEIMANELANLGSSYATTVLSKIRPFTDINPFTQEEDFDWHDIRDERGIVYIIQLTGYDRHIQLLLTELLLWDIWSFCVKNGDETKPFPIVLDEAQNLSHGIDSPSAKILTEGRKFGVSGWYATQFMKPQLSDDEIQRLQQAGQKLYFCPPDDGVTTVAKNIDINAQNSKEWAEKLKKLKKGECVTCGSMVRKDNFSKYEPRIIKITSMEERVRNAN